MSWLGLSLLFVEFWREDTLVPEKSTCTLYTVNVFGHFIIDNGYICIILQGLFFLAYICRKIAFCSIKPSCYLLLDKKNIHMQTARLR